jgi:hypothetical protein
MRLVAVVTVLALIGCSFRDEPAAVTTVRDLCAARGAWSFWAEADWVRKVVEAGGYDVVRQRGSALVASGKGHEFSIWATRGTARHRPYARRLANVRGVPVYGKRDLWRYWYARGFTFWVQGAGPLPAAGRLAPVVDASLRIPFRDPCAA